MKTRIAAPRIAIYAAATLGALLPAIAGAATSDSLTALMTANPGSEGIATLLAGLGFITVGLRRKSTPVVAA